jgi:RNA polymerase sigma factor, sigma-70 family
VVQIDVKLFETHIDNYKDLIYAICFSFVKNPYDAEDLAQETFVAAYRNFSGFDNKNPKSWFATIAANKCRDFLKSPARRVSLVETGDLEYISDTAFSVEEEVERNIAEKQAHALCCRLKEPYRSVALAYYCDDETITDISERTGDNRKTVATRLYRARNLIKIILKEEVGI